MSIAVIAFSNSLASPDKIRLPELHTSVILSGREDACEKLARACVHEDGLG